MVGHTFATQRICVVWFCWLGWVNVARVVVPIHYVFLLTRLCYQRPSSRNLQVSLVSLLRKRYTCYTLCSSADWAMFSKSVFRSHSCLSWVSVARAINPPHTLRCIDSIWGPSGLTYALCQYHSRRTLTFQKIYFRRGRFRLHHSNAQGIYVVFSVSVFLFYVLLLEYILSYGGSSLQMALKRSDTSCWERLYAYPAST